MELLLKSVFPQNFNLKISTEEIDSQNIFASIQDQQKQAQKVAEDITKRFYVLYQAYERIPNKSPKRQRIQNEIFEKFNELKQNQNYNAVSIALKYAIGVLGTWDYVNNSPSDDNSVANWLWTEMNKNIPFEGVTPEILVQVWQNSIGFYDDLVSNYIPTTLNEMMTEEDNKLKDSVKNIIDEVIKPMWVKAMAVVGDRIVDEILDRELIAVSDQDKEDMKAVAKDWLHKNMMYGDLNAFTSYVYNNAYSSNPIIKQAFHLIQEAETKTLEEVHPSAERIVRAFRKIDKKFKSLGNWQTRLMEFDRNGIPTGNFVRPINYGQYQIDLTEFIKDLNNKFDEKYGFHYEDDGSGLTINSLTGELASEEEWGENGEEPTYITYLKEIEKWKCNHSERRYTYKYYEERLSRPYKGSIDPRDTNTNVFGHGLSPKTLARYNYIQSNINYYLDMCTDPETGFSYPERLFPEDKKKLDDWKYELDKLSNPYNEDETNKVDEDRQMAFEILAWQKFIGDALESNVDFESFEKEYNKILEEAKNTNNPNLIYDFFKYNSRFGIHPDFIKQTLGAFSYTESLDPISIHSKLLKRALQNLIKTSTGYTRDLQKMENNPSFWLDCKHTDQYIENGKIKQNKDFADMLNQNFEFQEILYRDANGFAIDSNGNKVDPKDEKTHNDLLTYQQYLINKYTSLAITSPTRTIPGLNDENGNPIIFNGNSEEIKRTMTYLFTYEKVSVDHAGYLIKKRVPLSIFSIMLPKNETFVNQKTGKTERTMLYIPTGRFTEKYDKYDMYINQSYDYSDMNAEQPKRSIYDNTEAYDKILSDTDVERLYNILIEEMQNAQLNYQSTNRRFNYRLPQVEANTMQIFSRMFNRGIGNTFQALWESATNVQENDESMRTSDQYATNPDGSIATDIPLKFIRKLKHPEYITTDVVGSVILFINMAVNYKNKTAIDAQLKTLRYNMDFKNRDILHKEQVKENPEEIPPFDNKYSQKMYDSMMNKHVYGNQWASDSNQPNSSQNIDQTNVAKSIASSTLMGAVSGAATGALWGTIIGSPGIGSVIGTGVGAGVGALGSAIKNGLFDGVGFFKTIKNIQRIETTQMLAANIFSMLVGFGDSITRITKESLMFKYMTPKDTLTALMSVLKYTPACIANIGNPLANNKLSRAMQLNGISKGVYSIYEKMNYGRFRKIVSNLLMGGFSMLDWMANALLMRSFYNNVRFYDGNVIPKGFYTSYEFERMFINAGKSKWEGRLAFEMSTQTLWGAYNKDMEVKEEWKQYVTQRVKNNIRTKTLKRSALYNGMNPDNDIPLWKQDIIGGLVGALRAWLPQAIQHLTAGGTDNIIRETEQVQDTETQGTRTKSRKKTIFKPLTEEQAQRAFSWDYETGTIQDQVLIGIGRSFKNLYRRLINLCHLDFTGSKSRKFSELERRAWWDAIIYLGFLGIMMVSWPSINDWANEINPPKTRQEAGPESLNPVDVANYFTDVYIPNEYYRMAINDVTFRVIESQLTSIDPKSTSDVLSSITAITSGLGDHFGIINAVSDVTGASGHSLDEVNKQGSYKYYTRGERDVFKFIGPLDNLHTSFTYQGSYENLKFYTNTYGWLWRIGGYDFKKPRQKKEKPTSGNFGYDGNFGGNNFGGDNNFGGNNFGQ